MISRRAGLARYKPIPAGVPLKRRSSPWSSEPLPASGFLKPRSVKRRSQEAEYRKLRVAFLDSHPRCAFPLGCGALADTVQHLRGRRGVRLLDTDWWAPSCWMHNAWAEDHTGEALAIGWLVRIEGVQP